jgi:hypothetical protein
VVAGPILGPKWLAWLGQLPSHFSSKILNLLRKNGAGDEIRTHDIHLGKVALYP